MQGLQRAFSSKGHKLQTNPPGEFTSLPPRLTITAGHASGSIIGKTVGAIGRRDWRRCDTTGQARRSVLPPPPPSLHRRPHDLPVPCRQPQQIWIQDQQQLQHCSADFDARRL